MFVQSKTHSLQFFFFFAIKIMILEQMMQDSVYLKLLFWTLLIIENYNSSQTTKLRSPRYDHGDRDLDMPTWTWPQLPVSSVKVRLLGFLNASQALHYRTSHLSSGNWSSLQNHGSKMYYGVRFLQIQKGPLLQVPARLLLEAQSSEQGPLWFRVALPRLW